MLVGTAGQLLIVKADFFVGGYWIWNKIIENLG